MRTTLLLLIGLTGMASTGLSQQQPPRQQATQQQAQQLQRMQEMHQQMEQLAARLHETNRWMSQNRSQQQFRDLGREMELTGDRIREMLKRMDRIHQDPDLQRDRDRDRDRLQEFDRLQERLRDMTRDLDQAHDALRKMIGKP